MKSWEIAGPARRSLANLPGVVQEFEDWIASIWMN
jgi:hypothetical protein